MQIRCLNPVIIRNHVDRYKINYRDWTFYIRGHRTLSVPSPRKAKIIHSDLDTCYFLNNVTGEIVPMYIEVPCNHCILCQDKKATDWTSRIIAETNAHDNHPWWITLTYNNYGLPKDRSISKKELSNFIKRLRERVSRVIGSDIRLRFVGTGEYGGNYGRPHYHLELFGLPVMHANAALVQIENAWSSRVSKKVYMSLPVDFRFMRYDKNKKPLYYQRKGFCYVKPAHDNTPAYLCKYMFKPEMNTPFGCTPNFNLSSRRNGIGYNYVEDMRGWHRLNPNETRVSITNKFTGKTSHFGMCNYYKDYIFPSTSKVLPSVVKKEIDSFRNSYNEMDTIIRELLKFDVSPMSDIDTLASDISYKYSFLPPIVVNPIRNEIELHKEYHIETSDEVDFLFHHTSYEDWLRKKYLRTYCSMFKMYNFVMAVDFVTEQFEATLNLRDIYKAAVSLYMRNQPDINLQHEAEQLRKYWYARKRKDMN